MMGLIFSWHKKCYFIIINFKMHYFLFFPINFIWKYGYTKILFIFYFKLPKKFKLGYFLTLKNSMTLLKNVYHIHFIYECYTTCKTLVFNQLNLNIKIYFNISFLLKFTVWVTIHHTNKTLYFVCLLTLKCKLFYFCEDISFLPL